MYKMSEIEMCMSSAKERYRQDESVCKWAAFIALCFAGETVHVEKYPCILFFAAYSQHEFALIISSLSLQWSKSLKDNA